MPLFNPQQDSHIGMHDSPAYRNSRRNGLALPLLLIFVLVGEGCARQREPEQPGPAAAPLQQAQDASPASTESPADTGTADDHPPPATGEEPEPGDTAPDYFEGTAGIVTETRSENEPALLHDVRTARHNTFDRVVFEFGETALPGYHIEYVDKPVRKCGSGETTQVAGDGWLEVRIQPANAHSEEGYPTVADRERDVNFSVLKELELTCDFEAHVTWVLGVRSPNPYRVLELSDPSRLVIDIRH